MIRGSFFTTDNELVFIEDPEDLAQLVQRKIGYEAAGMVRELAQKATREAHIANTDLRAYESELSELQMAIRELEGAPEWLEAIARRDRLTKANRAGLKGIAEKIRGLLGFT